STNILSYDDFADISEYAVPSVQYAMGSGLLKGRTETELNPKDNATRVEAAAILHRFIEANK
ncbi:MAG: S-layer homology domain-containing protein, partial [Clostridia bacterium]|nr:S-layer homology domain-containing protein [Clostridia bacterium]